MKMCGAKMNFPKGKTQQQKETRFPRVEEKFERKLQTHTDANEKIECK